MIPTYFIHGANASPTSFNYLASRLPCEKHFAHYNVNGPWNDIASNLFDTVPDGPFNIVGHSLGGLLGTMLANETTMPIKKVVTLGAPFGGSSVSFFRWLLIRDHFFDNLDTTVRMVNGKVKVPTLSFVSTGGNNPFLYEPNDGVVTVRSQKAVNSSQIEIDLNHFETLLSDFVVIKIKEFFND